MGKCIFFGILLASSLKKQSLMKGSLGLRGLDDVSLRLGGRGVASDLQHSCALAYQVSQSEFLRL